MSAAAENKLIPIDDSPERYRRFLDRFLPLLDKPPTNRVAPKGPEERRQEK